MQVWIGTSGYSYPDWVGAFYPPGTKSGRMLAYYAQRFPLVELNFTFYRLPTAEQLARLAEQTPEGFQFLVKLPRSLSHERDARALAPFRQALGALQQRGRLLGLLCQLPQSFHHDPDAKKWIAHLGKELSHHSLAVEFRHQSWCRDDVARWLGEHQLDLVAVDVPDLPGLYPRRLVQSGRRVYVRFHSRNAGNWYRSDKERYDYDYRDEELTEWIAALAAAVPQQALLLFNNCHRAHAAENAKRMRELIGSMSPAPTVVEPFAGETPGGQQGLLFD